MRAAVLCRGIRIGDDRGDERHAARTLELGAAAFEHLARRDHHGLRTLAHVGDGFGQSIVAEGIALTDDHMRGPMS